MAGFEIISYGKLHGTEPDAHVHIDLRTLLRDPHLDPELREMTGKDQAIVDNVLRQPGAHPIIEATYRMALAVQDAGDDEVVRIAIACAGGRHRSVVIADHVASSLRWNGWPVTVTHRDLPLPVVQR